MSILNVLLSPSQLLVAVDTLAEDARTGAHSSGAKMLLIPQHNLVMAARGSTQFFFVSTSWRFRRASAQISRWNSFLRRWAWCWTNCGRTT